MRAVRSIETFSKTATPGLRRLVVVYSVLASLNVGTWIAIVLASVPYPLLLGLGLTAYGFGLRNSVDPDYIAAIDNTTRKLMQDGKRPVAVGFFFSLGHSTVVLLLSVVVAVSAVFVKTNLPTLQSVGGVIGTSVSGLFLLIVAPKTGRTLRYVLPRSDRQLMDAINEDPSPLQRHEAVMSTPAQQLFRVDELPSPHAAAHAGARAHLTGRSPRRSMTSSTTLKRCSQIQSRSQASTCHIASIEANLRGWSLLH